MAQLLQIRTGKKEYCVYTHSHAGQVFYVGIGNQQRPYECVTRNHHWKAFTAKIEAYDITILHYPMDRRSAEREEKRLIQTLRPVCNLSGNPNYKPFGRGRKSKEDLPHNRVASYRTTHNLTMLALAAELGVSEPTVSRWEAMQHEIPIAHLLKMAGLFRIKPCDIIPALAQIPADPKKVSSRHKHNANNVLIAQLSLLPQGA